MPEGYRLDSQRACRTEVNPKGTMNDSTISAISRRSGRHRLEVAALIDAHGIPTVDVGPSRVVTPAGMKRLQPLLDRLMAKAEARTRKPRRRGPTSVPA
jgi:hypothetical protein